MLFLEKFTKLHLFNRLEKLIIIYQVARGHLVEDMKRNSNLRDSILYSGSHSKRRKLQVLLEELAKPEIDVSALSQHTTMSFVQIQQQNLMIIPQLIRQIRKQSEPIVLEITKNKDEYKTTNNGVQFESCLEEVESQVSGMSAAAASHDAENGMNVTHTNVEGSVETEGTSGVDLEQYDRANGEKQFEIIFSDSVRPTDAENENHIIHSTTECTAATPEDAGTVNVPNSFPLFQIVHTGEVSEDLQEEIVRLIRQANPELDLNSITFKFKSPETVEIIANVNS